MARRSYSGTARATTLNGGVTAAATSMTLADATGYPTGAAGPFVLTIAAGTASEEKVLVASRSSNTLTVSSRGWDGTTASAHDNGDPVAHTYSATDADEANAFINGGASAAYVAKGDVASATVVTVESTTATAFADLATVGPAVTVTIGSSGRALVIETFEGSNDTAGQYSFAGYALSGATTAPAEDRFAASVGGAVGVKVTAARAHVRSGLTPGSTTFTSKYRVTGGTGVFERRDLIVIPL